MNVIIQTANFFGLDALTMQYLMVQDHHMLYHIPHPQSFPCRIGQGQTWRIQGADIEVAWPQTGIFCRSIDDPRFAQARHRP
ncbi:hypothetical protein D3C77_624170 [compost metagenome]